MKYDIKHCQYRPLTRHDNEVRIYSHGVAAGHDGGRRVIQGPARVPGNGDTEYVVRASVRTDPYRVQDGEIVPDDAVVYACDILVDWDGDGRLESIVHDLDPDAQRGTLEEFLRRNEHVRVHISEVGVLVDGQWA